MGLLKVVGLFLILLKGLQGLTPQTRPFHKGMISLLGTFTCCYSVWVVVLYKTLVLGGLFWCFLMFSLTSTKRPFEEDLSSMFLACCLQLFGPADQVTMVQFSYCPTTESGFTPKGNMKSRVGTTYETCG